MVSRKKFLCADCGVDTGKIGEFYFVNTSLWLTVMPKHGMLCIEHLEKRLGRKLRPSDFTQASINNPRYGAKSNRLMQRMGYR